MHVDGLSYAKLGRLLHCGESTARAYCENVKRKILEYYNED